MDLVMGKSINDSGFKDLDWI